MSSANVIPSNIFLYKPDAQLPDLSNYLNQTIEVKIERKYISKENPNVIKRKIWGSENYTSNSDIVCILFHFHKFNYEDFIGGKLRDGVNLWLSVGKRRQVIIQPRRPTTVSTRMVSALESSMLTISFRVTL